MKPEGVVFIDIVIGGHVWYIGLLINVAFAYIKI